MARNSANQYATLRECEASDAVRKRILGASPSDEGNVLNRRIPILWHEMGGAETADYADLYALGAELFGSHNALMPIRRIAQKADGVYWIPYGVCSADAKARAKAAFDTERDYSYAYNKPEPVGAPASVSVEQFAEIVAKAPRGGNCAFYLIEVVGGGEHFWKTGVAFTQRAALRRLRFRRDRELIIDPRAVVRCHCLITDLADEDTARELEDASEKTFGDICRLWKKNSMMRQGGEQFRNDQRMHNAAKLLSPLTVAPAEYLKEFSISDLKEVNAA